ncbi:nuclear transport factor 2 family protein [Streptomyces coeruleorubidus]|uniref:nuclear transport factor 2 family protein n=1 Tax=Streptomyces coeruleorubidus TaxID=116188 RepID=UPI0036755476
MIPEDATAWSLSRLTTAFHHHYDRREHDAVVELFTRDALYEMGGRGLRGHAEILSVLNARPQPEQTVRHIMGATHFHAIGDISAQGAITVLGYGAPTPTEPGPAPYPAAAGWRAHLGTDRPLSARQRPLEDRAPHRPPHPRSDPRLRPTPGSVARWQALPDVRRHGSITSTRGHRHEQAQRQDRSRHRFQPRYRPSHGHRPGP